jgi:transposase
VRRTAPTRVFDDGPIALDNNPAERALRSVAIKCKHYLFAGSERGAKRTAAIYTLTETAKLNGLDPETYLADVITCIVDGHPQRPLVELLPWA